MLQQRLADLGDIDGRNVVLLTRFAGPQPDRIQEAVISLASQADLLVVWGPIAALAAKNLPGNVPTVFISVSFPVEIGFVQSLAHPGGKMTGIAAEADAETYAKRVQILKEIVPNLNRVAVVRPVGDPNIEFDMKSLDLAARKLGVTILPVDLRSADAVEAAFASIKESGAEALIVIRSALASAVADGSPSSRLRHVSLPATPSAQWSRLEDYWWASPQYLETWFVPLQRRSTRSSKGRARPTYRSSSRRDWSCRSI